MQVVFADEHGAASVPESGSLYPYFINESAYYEKDIAFYLGAREMRGVRRLAMDTPPSAAPVDA